MREEKHLSSAVLPNPSWICNQWLRQSLLQLRRKHWNEVQWQQSGSRRSSHLQEGDVQCLVRGTWQGQPGIHWSWIMAQVHSKRLCWYLWGWGEEHGHMPLRVQWMPGVHIQLGELNKNKEFFQGLAEFHGCSPFPSFYTLTKILVYLDQWTASAFKDFEKSSQIFENPKEPRSK